MRPERGSYCSLGFADPLARSFLTVLYWTAQIFGSFFIGMFLDSGLSRRMRAYGGWAIVAVLTCVIMGGNLAAQTYTRESVKAAGWVGITVGDSPYAGRSVLASSSSRRSERVR